MRIRHHLTVTAIAWATLGLFLALSTPSKLPVVVFIVPFVLLFVALYSLWRLGQRLAAQYTSFDAHRKRLGLGVCTSIVVLLVLQSLGQLMLRDVITLAAIVIVGYLYFGRTSLGLPRR